jgi:hypothetical protein
VAWTDADSTYYSLPGPFAPSTDYYFRVKAFTDSAESAPSNVADVTTAAWPAAPTGLVAWASSDTQIELTWTDNSENELGFVLQRTADGLNWSNVPITDHESASDSGLTPGELYVYRLAACNAAGESGYAYANVIAGLSAPSGLVATAASAGRIELDWDDNEAFAFAFYSVYASTDAQFVLDADTLIADQVWDSAYSAAGLEPSTTYYFRVTACDWLGLESAPSGAASATTDAAESGPVGLTAQREAADTIELNWSDSFQDELYFEIQASSDAETYYPVAWAEADSTAYTFWGLPLAETFHFQVRAVLPEAPTAWSGTASASTAPHRPATGPIALEVDQQSIGYDRMTLSWTNPGGQDGTYIEYSMDGVRFQEVQIDPPLSASATQYTVTGLRDGTTYHFRARSYNAGGVSPCSNEDAGTTPLRPPSNLEVSGHTPTEIKLEWHDNSDAERGYIIETTNRYIVTQPNATSYILAPDWPGVVYDFTVRAVNGTGESAAISGSGQTAAAAPPAVPTGFTATAVSNMQIDLKWDFDPSLPIYKLEWYRDAGYTDFVDSVAIGGLASGYWNAYSATFGAGVLTRRYYFRVRAENGAGPSAWVADDAILFDAQHPDFPQRKIDLDITYLRTNTDEGIEALPGQPGTYIPLNDGDRDGDGIPDMQDGWGANWGLDASASFTPLTVDLSWLGSNCDNCTLVLSYDADALRIWTKDGGSARSPTSIHTAGDYVEGGREYTVALLKGLGSGGITTLYVEGIAPSAQPGDKTIGLSVYGGGAGFAQYDTVRVTVADVELTAHRTGAFFGIPVGDSVEGKGQADQFVVLVNDIPIVEGQPVDNTNLAKITLHQLPAVWSSWPHGAVRLFVSEPAAVRLWRSDGTLVFANGPGVADLHLDFAHPDQGPLADMLERDLELWLEGIASADDVELRVSLRRAPGFECAEDVVHLRVSDMAVDLDVDADNDNGFGMPDLDLPEDRMERAAPGKIINVNDNDDDMDGIPDFADGYALNELLPNPIPFEPQAYSQTANERFFPVVLSLSDAIDVDAASFSLSYDMSDPAQVTLSGDGSRADPFIFTPAPGTLRLWSRDGAAPRMAMAFDQVPTPDPQIGYFVPALEPECSYPAGDLTKLGFSSTVRSVTLWVESVRPSEHAGDLEICFTVWPYGDTSADNDAFSDTVVLTAFKADLGFNSNNNSPTLKEGVPDAEFDIDDADERWEDYDGYTGWWSTGGTVEKFSEKNLVDLIPLRANIPAMDLWSLARLRIRMEYAGSEDPELYFYPNVSPSGNRIQFLTDPATADAQMRQIHSWSTLSRMPLMRPYTETKLGDLLPWGAINEPGDHELLIQAKGTGTVRVRLTLLLSSYTGSNEIPVDSCTLTITDPEWLYSLVSARGTPSVPFNYPTDAGRTVSMLSYPYTLERDVHDPTVNKTLVFIHGYSVTSGEAEDSFKELYKRTFWAGFRGNFVGFTWEGDDWYVPFSGLLTSDGKHLFRPNQTHAFQSAPALIQFLRDIDATWGDDVTPADIDVMAHSLGNQVMWEAMRINSWSGGGPLFHNAISVEAAVWQEAFESEGPLTYSPDTITYNVDQFQRMSWRSWYNQPGHSPLASLNGTAYNSWVADDYALAMMPWSDFVVNEPKHYNRRIGDPYRSPTNLAWIPTLMQTDKRYREWAEGRHWYGIPQLNTAIGTMPNPIQGVVNISARHLGWRKEEHSDFLAVDHKKKYYFTEIYPWYRDLFIAREALPRGKD